MVPTSHFTQIDRAMGNTSRWRAVAMLFQARMQQYSILSSLLAAVELDPFRSDQL
jgi:hypothetical protein